MPTRLNVLIVEDRPADAELLVRELRRAGFEFDWQRVETETDYRARLTPDIDVILADYHLLDFHATDALRLLQKQELDIPFIVVTGALTEEVAVACLKLGAADYLLKDRPARLGEAVKQALQQKKLRQEKQSAIAALRESEERFRTIFENAPIGMIIANSGGKILQTNRGLHEILGYSKDELRQMSFKDIIHPDDLAGSLNLSQVLPGLSSNDSYDRQERRYFRKDGQVVWGDTTAFIIHDSKRKSQHTVTVIQDITERKIADEALRENEKRYRRVVSSISDHVYMTEVTPDGQIINRYISPNVEVLTGYAPEQIMVDWSLWPTTLIHPDDRAIAAEQMAKSIQGYNGEVEYRLARADGDIIWVRDNVRVESVGASKTIYGVVSDITERKQAQEALEAERASLAHRIEERTSELRIANAKLARASRLKDEFLASMSHELRTPLNAILGMAEVLQEQVYGAVNEKQSKSIQTIEESGRHLLSLINDILDLSKIEAGKLRLDLNPVSIMSLCQASLQFVKQTAHKKRLKLSAEYDEAATIVQADERRLKQILVNLLSNAVKFTPEGGTIGLTVTADPVQQVIQFTVWDTGIGITENEIDRLFQPFVQLDSSLSREYSGTGLGLSLVYRLAEMHGGSVSVESEVGQGSRFNISLPWQPATGAEPLFPGNGSSKPVIGTGQPVTNHSPAAVVLLAEDNEANIKTLSDYLLAKGYRLVIARNGAEAIERAEAEPPDVILMDIQMPDIDGLEATRRLRANPAMTKIPVIALTALAMPGDRERCLAAGVNEYLSKPVSLQELVSVIETQLRLSWPQT